MGNYNINVGTIAGGGFNEWYVFVCHGDMEFKAGPFRQSDVEEVARHYRILMEMARKSVQAELRQSLGMVDG